MASPQFPQDEWQPRGANEPRTTDDTAASGATHRGNAWEDAALARLPELRAGDLNGRPRRRFFLPLFLFAATCLSTFWVGASSWMPLDAMTSWQRVYLNIVAGWAQGVTYMMALMAILITHEMGHFLFALRYHIPASYPMFIPLPINPIGTMGAVIGLDGLKADRRQLFDLGLAGPLAGLLVAVPVVCMGIQRLDLESQGPGQLAFHNPLLVKLLITWLRTDIPADATIGIRQLNPFFLAGWVGLLITGLNMLPISQLDGGHVAYALFGRGAHTVARAFLVVAIVFVVVYIYDAFVWTMMLILVILIGTDHPPTSNDHMELGRARTVLGMASLAIPILCFPLWGIDM